MKNFKNTLMVSALSLGLMVGAVGMVSAATSASTDNTATTPVATPAVHMADTPVAHSAATPATPAVHMADTSVAHSAATPASPAVHTADTTAIYHDTNPVVTHNETGHHISDSGSGHHE